MAANCSLSCWSPPDIRDEAVFARFYQLTSPWILYLLRRRTRFTSDAEDSIRLVYTTIWR